MGRVQKTGRGGWGWWLVGRRDSTVSLKSSTGTERAAGGYLLVSDPHQTTCLERSRPHPVSQVSESFGQNWWRPSPTGVRRQRTSPGAHGGARPPGPETPAAGLPQPALCTLAHRVAGRGSQQGAPHTIRISKGGSRPGLMGQVLGEPDHQARPDSVPYLLPIPQPPAPPGTALTPALPTSPAQRQRS